MEENGKIKTEISKERSGELHNKIWNAVREIMRSIEANK